jgi:hypothetical protein
MNDRAPRDPDGARPRARHVFDPVARTMQRIQRGAWLEPEHGPGGKVPAPGRPGEATPVGVPAWAGVASAVAAPVAVATLLVAVRGSIGGAASLVMVLPVLAVSVVAGVRAGAFAALVGAAAYAVLLTEPYYRFSVADTDDLVETVVLLAIGLVVGALSDRSRRDRTITGARGREVDAVTRFLHDVSTADGSDAVASAAERAIVALLSARECEWRPGYHGTVGAVLGADGSLSTGTSAPAVGSGLDVLPPTVEIPVGSGAVELGRFVVRTDPNAAVSIEERRAAVGVAAVLSKFAR